MKPLGGKMPSLVSKAPCTQGKSTFSVEGNLLSKREARGQSQPAGASVVFREASGQEALSSASGSIANVK